MRSLFEHFYDKPKVLIIDDEEEILESLRRRFELEGITVDTNMSSTDALDNMINGLHNVVISDIKMPEIDGITLVKKLKDINPFCNIIIMTGYSNMEYVIECLSSGVCDYFTKPLVDLDSLVDAVKQAINRVERWKKGIGLVKKGDILCKTI